MDESEAADEVVAQLARVSAERPDGVRSYLPPPLIYYPEWMTLGLGIAIAAGVYPTVVTVSLITIGGALAILTAELPASNEVLEVMLSAGTAVTLGGAVFAFLAGLVGVPVLFLAWTAIHLMQVRAAWTTVGAFCGGSVGFVLWLPASHHLCQSLLIELQNGNWSFLYPQPLLFILIGPVLAILTGQVGGAYGGLVLERAGFGPCSSDSLDRPRRMSFSIRQLLGLTLLLSLALAALRLAGLLNAAMFLAVACWLGLQITLRRPAVWLSGRIMSFLRRPRPRGYLVKSAHPTSDEGAA